MASQPQKDGDLSPTIVTHILPHTPDSVETPGPPPGSTSTFDSERATLAGLGSRELPTLGPPIVPGDLGVCGGYRVVKLLGRGGMGAVYEAIDTALGRRVALKLMLPDLATSDAGRERFLREARAAALVRHENVVNVYSVGEADGVPYLTMELLRGDHMGTLFSREIPLADVVRIGREVACGLAAAHALGVIHRDIKPPNIWIEQPSGRVRLLDFGLARFGGEVSTIQRGAPGSAAELTQYGALVGTPAYMAPEQISGEAVDARTDLFALGTVLYQMVTGRAPFGGNTLTDLSNAVRSGIFPSVSELAPNTPTDLVRLIHWLLAIDPAHRPQSATVVADELLTIGTRLLVSSGGGAVAVPHTGAAPAPAPAPAFEFESSAPPAPGRIETPRKLLLGIAALLLLVGAAAGAGYWYKKKPAPVVETPPAPAPVVRPPARPAPAAFTPLFNGRDLAGWRPSRNSAVDAWAIQNGVLTGTQKPTDQVLLSDTEFADFELRLEYRWPKPGGHTVVLLRATDSANLVSDGLGINIGDDEGFPAIHGRGIGGLYRTGLVQGVTFNPTSANRAIGTWNELHVFAKKQTIEVKLNGVRMPTAELAGKTPVGGPRPELIRPAGSVGLVCHWGSIEFRNITIRPVTE